MAIGMSLIPAILQMENQPIELVKVGAEINRHNTNDDLYTLYVAYGWKKMNKRWKKGGLKEVHIPRSHVIRVPNDFEPNGMMTATPKVICTVAHICHESLVRQKDNLRVSLIETEQERDEAESCLQEFMDQIKSSGTKSEVVKSIASRMEAKIKARKKKKDGKGSK
jgi:hypothetical protein